MKYVVHFEYMDGETFETEVKPSEMDKFTACVGSGEVYFSESAGVGIWIPIDKIRHFKVERVDEYGKRVKASNRQLPQFDGGVECGSSGDKKEGTESVEGVVPLSREELRDAISDLEPEREE